MDHQNTLKYLAFPEIICCHSFSFEECFSYVIKPHPISHLLKLSKQQRERTKKEIKQKREKELTEEGNKAKGGNVKFLRKKESTKPGRKILGR